MPEQEDFQRGPTAGFCIQTPGRGPGTPLVLYTKAAPRRIPQPPLTPYLFMSAVNCSKVASKCVVPFLSVK